MSHKNNPKGLGASALAKVCGVSQRTVRNWLSAAAPLPRYKRGTRFFFDPEAVAEWLSSQEKRDPLVRLRGYIASLEPAPTHGPTKSEEDANAEAYAAKVKRQNAAATREAVKQAQTNETEKVSQTTWNLFKVRDWAAKAHTIALNAYIKSPAAEKVVHQKNVNASADILRKLELDCLTIGKEMGLLIKVGDVTRIFGNVTAKIKRDLLTLPDAISADLAALEDEEAVAALLRERITDLLRELTKGLRHLGTQPKDQS